MKRSRVLTLSIAILLVLLLSSIQWSEAKIKPRIAVMDLRPMGVESYLGEAAAELLRTRLINDGRFIVVERALLQKIAHEQKLQMSGLVSTKTAVKIGRLVGANYIIVGSIMKLGSKFILSVRLINVQTAISKKSAEVRGSSEDDLDNMCAEALQRLFPPNQGTTNRPPYQPKKTNTKKTHYITKKARSISAFLKPYKNIIRGLDPSVSSMLSKFAKDGLSLPEKKFILWLAANDPKKQLSIALKLSMKGKITETDVKKLPNPMPIDDMFTDNHNNWALGETGTGRAFIHGGYFYITSKRKGYFNWFTPRAANTMISQYRKYLCEVSGVQESGDKFAGYYGIVFRIKDTNHFYFFFVDNSGNYNVGAYNGSWQSLTGGWKRGNMNFSTILVSAIGNRLRAYLSTARHEKRIFQTINSLFPYGRVGIAAGGKGEVRFSSFKVYISKTELWRKAHLY